MTDRNGFFDCGGIGCAVRPCVCETGAYSELTCSRSWLDDPIAAEVWVNVWFKTNGNVHTTVGYRGLANAASEAEAIWAAELRLAKARGERCTLLMVLQLPALVAKRYYE